jgi:hypothetical protein
MSEPRSRESEVDEVIERPRVRDRGGAKHRPLVEVVRGRDFFDGPAQVRREKRRRTRDAWQLVVVYSKDHNH